VVCFPGLSKQLSQSQNTEFDELSPGSIYLGCFWLGFCTCFCFCFCKNQKPTKGLKWFRYFCPKTAFTLVQMQKHLPLLSVAFRVKIYPPATDYGKKNSLFYPPPVPIRSNVPIPPTAALTKRSSVFPTVAFSQQIFHSPQQLFQKPQPNQTHP
jgi:hypothetical protein